MSSEDIMTGLLIFIVVCVAAVAYVLFREQPKDRRRSKRDDDER